MTVAYRYASGDLLEDRNTYFYTPYHGPPFMAAWRRSREAVLRELPPAAAAPPPDCDPAASCEDGGETRILLEIAFADLENSGQCAILENLIQRFEVTKRIHRTYRPDWRAVDRTDYGDLGLYLRFAELAEAAYSKTSALPALNVLLKCVDTLVAVRKRLSQEQSARLTNVIDRERLHVDRLEASMRE